MKDIKDLSDWALAMSGASVRIGILYSQLVEVWYKLRFKVIVGTSSGGLLALVAATGNIEKAFETVVKFKLTDIFKENPFTFWGRFMMFWRVFILNKNYLQDQSRLVRTIKSVISKESFDNWQNDPNGIKVYVNTVDPETKFEHWLCLNDRPYEEVINECLMATASIPVMTAPVFIKFLKIFGYDGGWRSHIGSHFVAKKYGHELNGVCSLLSRVEDEKDYPRWRLIKYSTTWKDWLFIGSFSINVLSILRFLYDLVVVTFFNWEFSLTNCWVMVLTLATNLFFLYKRGFAILNVIMRLFDIFNHQISEDDISNCDYECAKLEIPHIKIYSPAELATEGIYKTNPEQQQANYDVGKAHAKAELSKYGL